MTTPPNAQRTRRSEPETRTGGTFLDLIAEVATLGFMAIVIGAFYFLLP